MIDARSLRLLSALEARTEATLDELGSCRAELHRLQARVAELEAVRGELEAIRLELQEENRELSEQNRELDEHNARLRERLMRGEPSPTFPGAARRAQGLSALMGHRPPKRDEPGRSSPAAAERPSEPAPSAGSPPARETEPTQPKPTTAPSPPEAAASPPEPPSAEPQAESAPSPEALLAQWYQRYPQTFFKGHTRPLKVGIHLDLAAQEPWPEKLVRRALAGYVNLPRYLKAVREGAERIGLDGTPHGQVDAEAADHAHRKLERLQAERTRRGKPHRQRGPAARDSHHSRDSRNEGKPGKSGKPRTAKRRSPPAHPPEAPATPDTANTEAATGDLDAAGSPEARMEAKLSALLAKHNPRHHHR